MKNLKCFCKRSKAIQNTKLSELVLVQNKTLETQQINQIAVIQN